MPPTILFEDEYLVVANKPAGLLVHKSNIDKFETNFLLQQLRDQLNCYLYPVHRLDKATSGAIAFAKSPEVASQLQTALGSLDAQKHYLLICRGFLPEAGMVNHPLKPIADFKRERKKPKDRPAQEAVTRYRCLGHAEINVAIDKYPQSRFSLVQATLETGRKHQLRRHFKHLSHPIIGCPKYGKSLYNRYFSEQLGASGLMLHAWQLQIKHPVTQQPLAVTAPLPEHLTRALNCLSLKEPVN